MNLNHTFRRLGIAVAGAGALAIAVAGPAAAHHCFKDEWQDAARAQLTQGKTPWMPMSDFIAFAITEEFGLPDECAAHADQFVAAWMTHAGVDEEPLIHMRATVGGGAAHQGRAPQPMSYLEDADFDYLGGLLGSTEDCQS